MQSLSEGRIRRTQSEWRAIVGRFESRDLSEAASCHTVEVSRKSFRMWRARLAGDVAFQRVQATRKPRPNPFTEAARHALKLRASLEVFRSDPDVPIDTNHLERALRPIPVGGGPGYSAGLRSGRRRSGSSRA